jgi:hypothetical protein
MKKIILGLIALSSVSAFSATLNLSPETTVEEAILTSNCSLVVKNKPILISRGKVSTIVDKNQDIVLQVKKDLNTSSVRRLGVQRAAVIDNLKDLHTITFTDSSVEYLYSSRITFREMTLKYLSDTTEQSLAIECSDTTPVDI